MPRKLKMQGRHNNFTYYTAAIYHLAHSAKYGALEDVFGVCHTSMNVMMGPMLEAIIWGIMSLGDPYSISDRVVVDNSQPLQWAAGLIECRESHVI